MPGAPAALSGMPPMDGCVVEGAPAVLPGTSPPAGCVVELRGLSRGDLNGLQGICLPQTDELRRRGRVGVCLDDAREVSVGLDKAVALYTFREFDGKGVGVVAQLHIKVGTLLLRERPVFFGKLGGPLDKRQLSALSAERHREVFELCDAYAGSHDEKTLEGIVSTNGLPRGPRSDEIVLCVLASRFNHSCAPNAEYLWVEGTVAEEVRAVREIRPGEEICVNYLGDDVRLPLAARQAHLREGFRFHCRCQPCLAADPASDERRARLVTLGDQILCCRDQPEAGLRMAEEMLELLQQETIGAPRTAAQVCNDGFELALLLGDPGEIQSWALMSYEAHRLGWGEDYAMTRRMKHYAQHPPALAPQGVSRKTVDAGGPHHPQPAATAACGGTERGDWLASLD